MIIYIEYVLIDNFFIDFFLLSSTFITTRQKYRKSRVILCSLMGAFFALFYPYFNVKAPILIVIKALFGVILVWLSNNYKSVKKYYLTLLIFMSYTFVLGGAIMGLSYIFSINFSSETSIAVMFVPAYFMLKMAVKVVKYVLNCKNIVAFSYKVNLRLNDTLIKTTGFLDSGNSVYFNGEPVIFLSKKILKELLKNNNIPKSEYIEINTVNGSSQKISFYISSIEIYIKDKLNIFNNVRVCVSDNMDDIDVILHPSFFVEVNNENFGKIKEIY